MHRRRPTTADYLRLTGIAAVLALFALFAAFAGAGLIAFAVAALIAPPISLYGNEYLKRHLRGPDEPSARPDRNAHQPHAG